MVGQLSNTSYIFLLKTEFSPKVKKKKKNLYQFPYIQSPFS